jgi:[ribosomal protein S18]-alanine N-acetyltransferase
MPIVPATPADLDAIMALECAAFAAHEHFPRRVWRHLLGPAARRRTALTLVLRGERDDVLDAALSGLLRRNSRMARIYSLAVDPACHRRGLGRALIAAFVRRLPSRCDTLSLEVRCDNAPARRLYDGLGLTVIQELPGYYPDGGDGLRYRAPLSALRLPPAQERVAPPELAR